MSDAFATSFGVLNYSGMLFNKGNIRAPLCSIIGGRAKNTNHVEFVVGQSYTTGGGSQPAISENASLTAPDATKVERSQMTNVTQIFQETVGISYGKESNMGTLSGVNIAGQQAAPINELDFQVAAKMQKIQRDIEYTYINGVYNKATSDSEVNKTRGLVNAISTNVISMDRKPLSFWDVAEMMKLIYESNAPTTGLCVWCDATTLYQLNGNAQENGLTVTPASIDKNGIQLTSVITPLGEVFLRLGECLPTGTALLLDLDAISPVYQPVPGKGNFFLEPLAKVGAGQKYQIFGQTGLDHGPEWYHGMFTNISTEFKAPVGRKIVAVGPVGVIDTANSIVEIMLDKTTVEPSDTNKVAVKSVVYNIAPASAPTLSYLWQVRAKTGTVWTDLTDSYTGYNTAELTIKAADAEKHYRCKVTSTGSVVDVKYSEECTVNAASTD